VFFTDVEVPAANLLGELDHGWVLTQASLGHERAMLWVDSAYDVQRSLRALIGLADRPGPDGAPLRDDARFRDDVAGYYVESQALMLLGYRGFSKFMRGRAAPEHSLLKLDGSETLQRLLLSATEWLGPTALDQDVLGPAMWRQGAWVTQYLRSFSGTIPGGTSEIQRNIIAERVLGLPRSERTR
jgi:alkylation response protein AidB-like acyl-CoA dehydrogenase